MSLNFRKNIFEILIILTSTLSFDNKSLTISIFSSLTAAYNAVWWIYDIISFQYMILNFILINDFKCNLKKNFKCHLNLYHFKFYANLWF